VIVATLSLPAAYDSVRTRSFQDDLLRRVESFGGVESAAFGRVLPFSNRNFSSAPIAVDGYVPPTGVQPAADYNEVGPGYLSTLGIPLVAGREFTKDDDERGALVAVVNEPMAAQYWPNESPVGKRLIIGTRAVRVVGVAKAAKYRSFSESALPFFYVPLRQSFSREVALNIRSKAGAGALAPQIRRAIRELDANVAPLAVITLRDQVVRSTTTQRMAVTLLSVFGGLALLLAAIGLYGVMSYLVSQSTGELGLRMALGATGSDVLRFVLSHGITLTAIGIGLGAVAALGSTRLLGDLLYRVSPRDPAAFGSALALMILVAIASCLAPGIRAARLDPVRALRRE
jgi:predicted permease